jgi:alpha-tubulin suppressor-like RCC1 family protein
MRYFMDKIITSSKIGKKIVKYIDECEPNNCGVKMISIGDDHTVALMNDGTVKTWGDNDHGQLGDGTTINKATPITIIGLANIVAIAAGNDHTVALRDDGTVWTWGDNGSGQLGDGTTTPRQLGKIVAQ